MVGVGCCFEAQKFKVTSLQCHLLIPVDSSCLLTSTKAELTADHRVWTSLRGEPASGVIRWPNVGQQKENNSNVYQVFADHNEFKHYFQAHDSQVVPDR